MLIYNKLYLSSDKDHQCNLKFVKMAKKWGFNAHIFVVIFTCVKITIFYLFYGGVVYGIFIGSGQIHQHIFQIVNFAGRMKHVLTVTVLEFTCFFWMQQAEHCSKIGFACVTYRIKHHQNFMWSSLLFGGLFNQPFLPISPFN